MISLCAASRSGGDLSFTCGSSLPGRRSVGADVQQYRNVSQMGAHCNDTSDYDLHRNSCLHILVNFDK